MVSEYSTEDLTHIFFLGIPSWYVAQEKGDPRDAYVAAGRDFMVSMLLANIKKQQKGFIANANRTKKPATA